MIFSPPVLPYCNRFLSNYYCHCSNHLTSSNLKIHSTVRFSLNFPPTLKFAFDYIFHYAHSKPSLTKILTRVNCKRVCITTFPTILVINLPVTDHMVTLQSVRYKTEYFHVQAINCLPTLIK